ncbi:12408_t:CDS:2 [Acaulospora colombiana]|uniref:12408_t:CDS:1 n=1 Tax=Acaulospora colombiana TaxID=27376 RepID=A0ACA9MAL2_9GLOM|nr:12408_t:CDS:2 [Acaulospora colombiana]
MYDLGRSLVYIPVQKQNSYTDSGNTIDPVLINSADIPFGNFSVLNWRQGKEERLDGRLLNLKIAMTLQSDDGTSKRSPSELISGYMIWFKDSQEYIDKRW